MSIRAKAPPTSLCTICAAIDFVSYFREPADRSKLCRHDLGKRDALRQRASQCAFCNLVEVAIASKVKLDGNGPYVDVSLVQCSIGTISSPNGIPASKSPPQRVYCIRIEATSSYITSSRKPIGYVQILAEDAASIGLAPIFRARVPPEDKFDMAMARRWLDICHKEHGPLCSEPDRTPVLQPMDILVIDLDSLCICKKPKATEFAALSYCWPADVYLTHLRANSAELCKPGSLKTHWNRLPGTIQDAINCAKDLGFRYLWVDALCIIQDSNEHKSWQLQQMDRVYGAAALTLVCAYPVPQNTRDQAIGFPGYAKHRVNRRRYVRLVQGMHLMVLVSNLTIHVLPKTRWDTRCWTYQEHHLSKRLLYFTHAGVYFSCSCNLYREDINCEDIPATAYILPGTTLSSAKTRYGRADGEQVRYEMDGLRLSRDPAQSMSSMIITYAQAITDYTYRDVSFNADMLNAFDGIRTVLTSAMGTEFWQGLPELWIDQAMCWVLRRPSQKRTAQPGVHDCANPLFPSWSWAGWSGPVSLNTFIGMQEYRTEAEWFIVNALGQSIQLRTCRAVQAVLTYTAKGNKNVAAPKMDIKRLLPKHIVRDRVNKVNMSDDIWKEAQILACWTTKATFTFDGTIHSIGGHEILWRTSALLAIKDTQGRTAGCILLPCDFADDCAAQKRQCSVLLISRALRVKVDDHYKSMKYFDTDAYEDRDWCTLNVMLASRLEDGRYVRVGVGVVHEDAWVDAKPEGVFVELI